MDITIKTDQFASINVYCSKCADNYRWDGEMYLPCCDCFTNDSLEATPHRCPVCEGKGQVPYNFYNDMGTPWVQHDGTVVPVTITWTNGISSFTQCRTCGGKGIVWKE